MKKQASLIVLPLKKKVFFKFNNYFWAFLLFPIFLPHLSLGQTQVWDKTYKAYLARLRATIRTTDGGYLLGGTAGDKEGGDKSEASRGGGDFWIVKLDQQGNKQWDKTYGGSSADGLLDMIPTPDGGYLLGGYSFSDKSGEKSEDNKGGIHEYGYYTEDFWVVKIDARGNKLWDKTFGGNQSDYLVKMAVAPDGGYLLAGNSDSDKSGDKSEDVLDIRDSEYGPQDFWIVKIDEKGTKLWEKAYTGDVRDELREIVVTPDGGYLLGGYGGRSFSDEANGTCDNPDCSGFWIIKITATGQQQWDKQVGPVFDNNLGALLNTPDGGFIAAGHDKEIVVTKTDSLGRELWTKTYSDGGERGGLSEMIPSPGGGYFLAGWYLQGDNNWLVEIDKNGEKRWDSRLDSIYTVVNLIALPDNNYIITGGYSSYQIAQIKWERQHNALDWDLTYGGNKEDNLTTVIKTPDGGYLAGGYINSLYGTETQPMGKNDYLIFKTDQNGQKLWYKNYGGTGDDYLNRIIQTQDGGYLLAGSSLSGKNGDKTQASKGGRDFWIIKTDKQGYKQWDKVFGGSGYDELKKVVQVATGEYVLGGYSNSPAGGDKRQASQGSTDLWLVKISKNGTKLWDKRYGGSQEEVLGSFTETRDHGFLLAGTSLSGKTGDKSQAGKGGKDYWVVKTDKEGNLLWEKTFGGTGEDEAYSVGLSQGQNVFIAGTSSSGKSTDKSQNSQGGKDYWLLELNKNGQKLWDKTFGGSQDDELRASTYTLEGHYVLAGSSCSGASGDKTQESQGSSDYWIVEVDEQGNKVYDKRFGGSGTEKLRTVTHTPDGGLLLGGMSGSPASGDVSQSTWGNSDFWLVKTYSSATPSVATHTSATAVAKNKAPAELITFSASPNPFQEKVTIRFTLPETQAATIRVLDHQGREVATLFRQEAQANQTYQVEWQAGKHTSGLYLLQLQTPTGQNTQKLLLRE